MPDVNISTSVPQRIADEVEKIAKRLMISKAAVVRQILASAVRDRAPNPDLSTPIGRNEE